MYNDFQNFWDKKWDKVDQIWPTLFALKTMDFLWEKRWVLLDVWSWAWRDSLYFAEKWFQVESFDFSQKALEHLKNYANKWWLSINTTLWDIKSYEFVNEKYNIIYSCNSLHYFSSNDTKEIFEKLKKSLKQGWLMFVRVKWENDSEFWKWEMLEENYFKNWEDLKHFFSIDYIKSLFSDFEIMYIEEVSENHNKINWWVVKSSFIDIFWKK